MHLSAASSLSKNGFSRACHYSGKAFSLVEVTLAMGIIAFAFVSIFGMLPLGMTTFRQTIDLSTASQIAQKVVGDAIQTDFDTLIDNDNLTRKNGNVFPANFTFRAPSVNTHTWRYFDDQGTELNSTQASKAIYHVLMRINPQVPLPSQGPAVPDLNELAQVTVQVVSNPANRTIQIADEASPADTSKPLRNLVDPSKQWNVYTYTAMVAKNK